MPFLFQPTKIMGSGPSTGALIDIIIRKIFRKIFPKTWFNAGKFWPILYYLQIERTTKQLSEALEEKKQLTNQNGELNVQHEATKTELQDIMKKLGKLF